MVEKTRLFFRRISWRKIMPSLSVLLCAQSAYTCEIGIIKSVPYDCGSVSIFTAGSQTRCYARPEPGYLMVDPGGNLDLSTNSSATRGSLHRRLIPENNSDFLPVVGFALSNRLGAAIASRDANGIESALKTGQLLLDSLKSGKLNLPTAYTIEVVIIPNPFCQFSSASQCPHAFASQLEPAKAECVLQIP
ncbi:hypothetical protein HF264_19585 [Rhizobium leguminosarum]|uniref:hypothetical protein n=1 Tax=Rhizobium leguminosarum TaxID=384 RepID=UPI001C91D751|nr:hypothetical protein [Rhizobium leguminosarum]MBY2941871.1 hypothetical protein [Rhizobium leguminosarum]